MDARNAKQCIVAVLMVLAEVSFPGFAGTVYTYGGDFNIPILDPIGPGSMLTKAIIEVPDHYIVSDLDVRINITHTNVFDLQIFLQSPSGMSVVVFGFVILFVQDIHLDSVFKPIVLQFPLIWEANTSSGLDNFRTWRNVLRLSLPKTSPRRFL